MDTRVKERLIGAVMLIGIIVAFVPEMLSGPHPSGAAAAPQEKSLRTYTIDLAPPAPDTGQAETENAPEPAAGNSVPSGTSSPAPEAPAKPSAAQSASAPGTPPQGSPDPLTPAWAVQLGSFASQENAERLAVELRRGGYRAFVSRFESGRLVRYRVRVGPEDDRARAEALAERLQREGRQVSIVAHP